MLASLLRFPRTSVPKISMFRACSTVSGTSSTTYSGGHSSVGQGGYYASFYSMQNRKAGDYMLNADGGVSATAEDISLVKANLVDLKTLKETVSESRRAGDDTAEKSARERARLLVNTAALVESMSRLMFKGSPTWGLSVEERSMVLDMRSLMLQLK